MSIISVKDVVIEFPMYMWGTRSIKKTIAKAATGGILERDSSERIVVKALDAISFEINEGDYLGLVGHNGSGKTTLLRLLAGIYEPSHGIIEVNGKITSLLDISMGMDQEASGLENIYLRGRVMGMLPKQMKLLMEDIVEFAGLGDYLHLPLRTYSSGMAMRLAFSVATSVKADILLMDEWLSVGDADFVEKAKERFDGMVSGARTIVVASHNLELINSKCNKIIRLEHGKIVEFNESNLTDKHE